MIRYKYATKLDMTKYLNSPDQNNPAVYTLQSIIAHSGDGNHGHYVAYINPTCQDPSWYKLDDLNVSNMTLTSVNKQTFGSDSDSEKFTAYVLFFLRDSDIASLLAK